MSAAPQRLDATLAALADPHRRLVVDVLRRGPKRAGDLARAAGMSGPAMSRHLRVLRRSRLIEETRVEEDARIKLYRLKPEAFEDLHRWLEEVRSFWTGQLDAFRTHVEAQATDEGE